MIYYYVKSTGVENQKVGVVVAATHPDTGVVLGTTDLLSEPSLIERFRVSGSDFSVALLPGYSVPVITFTKLAGGDSDTMNVTSLFGNLSSIRASKGDQEISTEELKVVIDKYVAIGVPVDIARNCVIGVSIQLKWENSSNEDLVNSINVGVNLIDSRFLDATVEFLNELKKSQVTMFKTVAMSENYTRRQNECTDVLFLELPDRASLLDDSVRVSSLIPKRGEVCDPYLNKLAYTPEYKKIGDNYTLSMVEGSVNNDTYELFDNEKLFHTAVCEWIAYNIKAAYGRENSIIDAVSQSFLEEMIGYVYTWHWSHNPNVPAEIDDVEAQSENDVNSIDSRYTFYQQAGSTRVPDNAILKLYKFLKDASVVVGYSVYADALVQLCRWGDRKPTCIMIKDYDYFFKLGTNEIVASLGDFSDYEDVSVGEFPLTATALIVESVMLADKKFVASVESACGYSIDNHLPMPIGVVVSSVKENRKIGKTLCIDTYYAMPDFIRGIVSGELCVNGVSFDKVSGKFSVDTSLQIKTNKEVLSTYSANENTLLSDPFYRSRGLKNLCLELNVGASSNLNSLLYVINQGVLQSDYEEGYRRYAFSNSAELQSLLRKNAAVSMNRFLLTNLFHCILGVLKKVACEYRKDCSTAEMFDTWYSVLKEVGYTSEASFYHDLKDDTPVILGGVKKEESVQETVTPLTAFSMGAAQSSGGAAQSSGGVAQAGAAQSSGGFDFSFIVDELPEGGTYKKIILGDVVLAYCFETKRVLPNNKVMKTYIILGDNKLSETEKNAITESISFISVAAYCLHGIFSYENKKTKTNQLFFDSIDTIKEFRNCVNKAGLESV